MNIVDENVIDKQRERLRQWRIPVRHIGHDIGYAGMEDEAIMPWLHQLRRPTLFTRDRDFYKPALRHARYCLVYLALEQHEVAEYVRHFLRHSAFNTQAKRMGCVIRVSDVDLTVWRLHANKEVHLDWLS